MIKSPCKDCENRNPGCHVKCEKYQGYREKISEEHEKAYAQGAANTYQAYINNKLRKIYRRRK